MAPTTQPTAATTQLPRGTVVRMIPADRLGVYLPVPDDASEFFAGHVSAKVSDWIVTEGDRANPNSIEGGLGRPDWPITAADVPTAIAKIGGLPEIRVEDIGPISIDSETGRVVWLHGLPIGVSAEQIRPLAVVVHAGRLYLVRPEKATGKVPSALSDLMDFVQQFDFIDLATYRGDCVTFTMPDSWQVSTKAGVTTIHQGDGILYGVDIRIESYPRGTPIEIERGFDVDPATISGRNLTELRASAEGALGPDGATWGFVVDGMQGFRFAVQQAALREPLAELAVIVLRQRVVVVTYTLLIEGRPDSETFRDLLETFKFER